MKKNQDKKRYIIIKTLIFTAVFAGFSVYAFYFPSTMNLLDKSVNRLLKTVGVDKEITAFSDYSEFVSKAADYINYAAEIVAENINGKNEKRSFSPVLTSCAAKFPLKSRNITSDFGKRPDPINGNEDRHSGIDIAAAEGSDVTAAWPGRIEETGFDDIYGNYIIIEHSKDFFTKYCHLSMIDVSENEFVRAEEKIGEAGNTGRSTGSHLHFEVIINGMEIDPMECFDI